MIGCPLAAFSFENVLHGRAKQNCLSSVPYLDIIIGSIGHGRALMFAEGSHCSHVVSTERGKLLGVVGSNAAADGRMRESFYDCAMKNETPILPENLKQFACELDQARRASIAGRGTDRIKCDVAQAYRNFEDAVREAPEYEEAMRQFYAYSKSLGL